MAILFPISFKSADNLAEAAVGTAQDSIITLSATKPTASVSLNVTSTSGSTATSSTTQGNNERATFTVATNNAKGYKLSIKSSSGTTLTNGTDTLDAIGTSGITLDTFSTNTWGYLPSYYNSVANSTLYYPITTSDVTLRETNTATSSDGISNPDTYTIALGLKADYTKSAGTYTNDNIVLTAIANPTPYTITYDKGNTTDTVDNIPPAESGSASTTSITLSSTVPTRTGYDFTGWCLGKVATTNNVDSCTNDTTLGITAKNFQPGASFGIDRTLASNTATLHAMWSIKTYALTVENGGNTTVTGSGTYQYGETVTITATPTTNTTCTTYGTPAWTKTSGEGALNSASGTSVTFTMGLGDAIVTATSTATNVSQTITLSKTNATGIVIDGVSNTGTSASLTCGSHTISGSFASGYEFSSWAVSGSVSLSSGATTASNSITVSGTGTLTLTGKVSGYPLTINFGTGIYGVMVKSGSLTGDSLGLVTTSGGTVTLASTSTNYYLIPLYKSQYTFNSWSASGGTVTSDTTNSYGYYYYKAKAGVTNTATISAKSLGTTSSTTMQNLAAASCTHAPTAVKDSRDNEVYYIQRLADGKCWMLENLRLGSTSTIALTTSNTNSSGNYTLPASGTVCFASSSCTGTDGTTTGTGYTVSAINTASKTTTTTGHGPGRNYVGVYYNYCAASAGTICSASNYSNASYDICPAGWKMPTTGSSNNSAGSYDYLYNTGYKANATAFRYALSTLLSGYFTEGQAKSQGTNSIFWSATQIANTNMYSLYVSSSSVIPASSRLRYYGYLVRCILK